MKMKPETKPKTPSPPRHVLTLNKTRTTLKTSIVPPTVHTQRLKMKMTTKTMKNTKTKTTRKPRQPVIPRLRISTMTTYIKISRWSRQAHPISSEWNSRSGMKPPPICSSPLGIGRYRRFHLNPTQIPHHLPYPILYAKVPPLSGPTLRPSPSALVIIPNGVEARLTILMLVPTNRKSHGSCFPVQYQD